MSEETVGLTWIDSAGGPLLLLARDLLPYWNGVRAGDEETEDKAFEETDYERACRVDEYLGVVHVAHGVGLVLGDEPLSTAWWPYSASGGILARWVACEDESAIVNALRAHETYSWEPSGLSLAVTSGPLMLFDAATPGDEVDEFLTVDLAEGSYEVDTLLLQPDSRTTLLLHRLQRRQR